MIRGGRGELGDWSSESAPGREGSVKELKSRHWGARNGFQELKNVAVQG